VIRMRIHEYLELDMDSQTISCSECDEELCDASQNYKEHSVLYARPIAEADPGFLPPTKVLQGASDIELRQFCCPNCATLFDSEVSPEDAEILHDVELDMEQLTSS